MAGLLVLRAPAQGNLAPISQAYSPAEVGTDSTSWTTVQGPDGILYFGCDALTSFDGERWRQFPIPGANALRGLDFANGEKLWAAALGEIGWFDQQPAGQWRYHSLRPQLPAEHAILGEVWHAFAEGHGAVFVSAEKIIRWDGEKMQVWTFPVSRRMPAMKTGGSIFVHHIPTGLYRLDADGPRLILPVEVLGKAWVLWMEHRSDGFLLATSEGLFSYLDGKLVPYAPEASAFIRRNLFTSAVRLADGRLVLGTFQGGLAIIRPDGSLEQVLTEKDGLPTSTIVSLYVDRNNELWVTSNAQIFRLSVFSPSEIMDHRSGLPRQPILKIVRSAGKISVASDNRVFELDPTRNRFQALDSVPKRMWELLATPDGLLIGGMGGILKLAAGETTLVHSTLQDVSVLAPSRFEPGSMFVSEGRSILNLRPDGKSRVVVENLPDLVNFIAEDNQGWLWLGSPVQGVLVARLEPKRPVEAVLAGTALGLPDGAGPSRVVAAADGTVLAFASSGAWIKGSDARQFVAVRDYPARRISAVSEVAADGTMWVVHPGAGSLSAAVARITVKGDQAAWQPHSAEGLWQVGAPKCIFAEVAGNGETVLWIGGTSGILRHVVAHGPVAPQPRPPLLRALARSVDDETLRPIAQPLPYSTRAIVFEFAAPEFARRPALHLETMLVGVDDRWVPADPTSRREFTALREGQYTFRVRVVAETGVASQMAASHFEITPPWWRTTAALVGALLALVPGGYGIYRLRVRTLRQRNAELETKVRKRTAELAQASAAKTQFIANMSHDIRNPLNGIVGLTLALEDTRLDAKQSELVATLRECTTYLSTLVDDVLDFASIEAGRVELRPNPFSPAELLLSIATMLKSEAIASGATLHVEAGSELPPAYVGDAGRIQQILVNYVSNALKYSGGRIRLSASIPIDAQEEIEFSVADEGPGISAEGQRVLFTKFTRLTASQSKEITGTGLGLASCRLLAGLMGGSVGVSSKPGQGARFYLRLPLETCPVSSIDAKVTPVSSPALTNCTVLVVEDTNYNAMAAAAVLARFGLSCERACTGAEALRLFAQNRHNLVLLDRNLPDMDGTEVARRIRALEADGPRTILLAVTAYCTTEDRALCLNAGMDAFVGKPLTPEKLRRVLIGAGRRHLAAASMHVSPAVSSTNVDVSLLEYLSDGTGLGLGRQIELFLTALGEAARQLDDAAHRGDFKALGQAAHGVLSHARLVGSSSLAAVATDLEHAAQVEDPRAFGDLLHRANREIRSLATIVRHYPGAQRPA